jgi:serine/threonine-protein kinase
MVADAGETGGLRPAVAFGVLGLVLAGVAALVGLSSQFVLVRQFELPKPPAALVVDARELIRDLGYTTPPADSLFGFGLDTAYGSHVEKENQSPDRWDDFARVRPSPLLFWYRESPRPLVSLRATGGASFSNPPMTISGMVAVMTDERGRLLDLNAVPDETAKASEAPADWSKVLAAAALDPALLSPAEPEWNPLVDCDQRAAWTGTYPDQPDVPIRVEAGSFAGRVVYFTVVAPWTRAARMLPPERGAAFLGNAIALSLICLMLVSAVLLARRNVKRGRGDTRGAFLMGGYLFFVLLVTWVLHTHHVGSFEELGLFADALETGLFIGAAAWVIYVALEPYARRQWPHALISWSRLLVGRFRDPLVGRDLLLGSLAGVSVAALIVLSNLIPRWLGHTAPPLAIENGVQMLTGVRRVAGWLFAAQPGAMLAPIGVFFLIFGLRVVVRKQWIAVALAFALMSVIQGLQMQQPTLLAWAVAASVWAILIFVIVRMGLLAGVISFIYANLLLSLPLTTDPSVWYFDRAAFGLLVLIGLTSYGVYLSIAGRPVFADSLLQEA